MGEENSRLFLDDRSRAPNDRVARLGSRRSVNILSVEVGPTPRDERGKMTRLRGTLLLGALLLVCVLPQPCSGMDLLGFRRGDCNADQSYDISDVVLILQFLFLGPPDPVCLDACDMDDDGTIDVNDVIYGLDRIFLGPVIFPEPSVCGIDPTPDGIDCEFGFCSFATIHEEGAFTLETGRVGEAYVGDLPTLDQTEVTWTTPTGPVIVQDEIPFLEYGFALNQELPAGLQLDPVTGVVSGTPTTDGAHRVQIWARRPDTTVVLFHVDLPIFTAAETEIAPTSGLDTIGPFIFAVALEDFDFEHEMPWPPPYPLFNCSNTIAPPPSQIVNKDLQVLYPTNAGGDRLPVLFFHHATGADWTDYGSLLAHLASHGVITVSVNDQFSYADYASYYCWGGHEEGARVLLATRDHVRSLTEDPTHPLYDRIDWTRVFYGGHSRGGGSATIASELDWNTRGLFLVQGTDARQDSWIGNTSRWIELPDVPVMHVSAEQDFDVIYPFAERLLERYRGPATMVTVYGGCHGYSTDNNDIGCLNCPWDVIPPAVDRCPYVSRTRQLDLTKTFGTAFFRRYGFDDLSVENLLYGDEFQGSVFASVAYKRNLSSRLVVDDFDAYPFNSLGLSVTSSGMLNIGPGSCYDTPFPLPVGLVPFANLVVDLPQLGTATLVQSLGSVLTPLDVSTRKKLTFRIKNHDVPGLTDNFGFSWLDFALSVQDADGDLAILSLNDYLPQTEFYPDPEPFTVTVRMKYQRFISLTVPLTEIQAANPNLDLDQLVTIAWQWVSDGTSQVVPRMGLDDIQFE